jgi:energy-coupling factor transport system ATP-binding protein
VAATFGIVFQDPEHQFVSGRVAHELRHGLAGPAGPGGAAAAGEVGARVDALLDRLHLAHLAGADPFTLSGGEQRRLSVGTALIRDPGLLLLDEPTFGQDPTTWAEVVDIIAGHRDAGGAVVLATHDPHLVAALGARPVPLAPVASRAPAAPATLDPAPASAAPPLAAAASGQGLRGLDPLALLGAALLLSVAGLVSRSVALNLGLAGGVVLAALMGRLGGRRLALLAVPALVAAASVAWSNALLSVAGVTSPEAWAAAALPASRVLAVALPGLVAAVAVDPTRLADTLVVRLQVPARAAYAALAGLRLLPLLADEWRTLERASRARGLGGRGPGSRARRFGSIAFRLLVAALRRAGRLAVALDVRGLRSGAPRTVARPVRWRWPDTVAMALGVLALAAALTAR